ASMATTARPPADRTSTAPVITAGAPDSMRTRVADMAVASAAERPPAASALRRAPASMAAWAAADSALLPAAGSVAEWAAEPLAASTAAWPAVADSMAAVVAASTVVVAVASMVVADIGDRPLVQKTKACSPEQAFCFLGLAQDRCRLGLRALKANGFQPCHNLPQRLGALAPQVTPALVWRCSSPWPRCAPQHRDEQAAAPHRTSSAAPRNHQAAASGQPAASAESAPPQPAARPLRPAPSPRHFCADDRPPP